jgi:hypothetical protein
VSNGVKRIGPTSSCRSTRRPSATFRANSARQSAAKRRAGASTAVQSTRGITVIPPALRRVRKARQFDADDASVAVVIDDDVFPARRQADVV